METHIEASHRPDLQPRVVVLDCSGAGFLWHSHRARICIILDVAVLYLALFPVNDFRLCRSRRRAFFPPAGYLEPCHSANNWYIIAFSLFVLSFSRFLFSFSFLFSFLVLSLTYQRLLQVVQ